MEKLRRDYRTEGIDEAEMAACMAAVYAFIAAEAEESGRRDEPTRSHWQAASLLESSAGLSRKFDRPDPALRRSKLWTTTGFPVLPLLVLSLLAAVCQPPLSAAESKRLFPVGPLTGAGRLFPLGYRAQSRPAQSREPGKVSATPPRQRRHATTIPQPAPPVVKQSPPQPAPPVKPTEAMNKMPGSGFRPEAAPPRASSFLPHRASVPPSPPVLQEGTAPAPAPPADADKAATVPVPDLSEPGDGTDLAAASASNEVKTVSGGENREEPTGRPEAPPQPKPTSIRVALALAVPALDVTTPDGVTVFAGDSGAMVAQLPPQSKWSLSCRAGQLAFLGTPGQALAKVHPSRYARAAFVPKAPVLGPGVSQGFLLPLPRPAPQAPASAQAPTAAGLRGYVLVPPGPDGLFSLNGKLYRGALWVRESVSAPGALVAINLIDLEDYLLSVVPAEMPSGWPLESLKAQAIAARSYAVANLHKHEADGYDVKATVEDQVYAGVATESEATNLAVAETSGIVIKHDGKPVPAFFHSTSGGSTEHAEFVWGKHLPYLHAVPDFDDQSPHFSWTRAMDATAMEAALSGSGRRLGKLLGLWSVSRSPSGRVREVLVTGTDGASVVGSDEIRRMLNLPSTFFNVGAGDGGYVFAGRGFGHGLGLSQWGARTLAEHGYNAAQILAYYYREVSLDYLD